MIPRASGNYKILLRMASVGMSAMPDKILNAVKSNSMVKALGLINDDGTINIELADRILSEGLANDEFEFCFKLLGNEYKLYLSANDISIIKSYLRR